jgi:hypothetical protein
LSFYFVVTGGAGNETLAGFGFGSDWFGGHHGKHPFKI